MINTQSWLDAGYRRYEVHDKKMNNLADFLLQKRLDDDTGKKYFITVYCYDRTKYPVQYRQFDNEPVGFMPTAHFSLRDNKPFFNIEMNGVEQMNSISDIEEWFEMFWNLLGNPYYEEWEQNDE